jgi:hypothetical protein
MTANPAKLHANARRLDRLNGEVARVLTTMQQRGEALHFELAWFGAVWWLSGGGHISDEVAQIVIRDARVVGVGDVLFNDVPAQTWRWIES